MSLRDRAIGWLLGETKNGDDPETKFTPADASVDWQHIQTLVHGPGAPGWERGRGTDFNSAVFACLMAIAMSYPEPPLRVYRKIDDDQSEHLPDSPLQQLLDRPTPNGELTMEDLLFWSAWAKHTDGNAYLLKVRAGDAVRGNVIELWPVSPSDIKPVTERDRSGRVQAWISHYRMRVGPNKYESVPVENIVHLRLGVDPEDRRLGLSPLKRLIREVATDDEATKFTDALLRNFAIPGIIITPRGATVIKPGDAERLEDKLQEKWGNDNRGKIAIFSADSEAQQFGYSPEQMTLEKLHRIPEERIAAVMGVPAIIAGLGAGLDRSTYSNARELREMYTETKLVPQWRADAARLTIGLKRDFSSDPRVYLAFDLSDVRALQEDMDAKYKRLTEAVSSVNPWLLRNEARAETGFKPIDGWDEEDMQGPAPIPLPFAAPGTGDEEDEDEPEEGAGLVTGRYAHKNQRLVIQARRRVRAAVVAVADDEIRRFFEGLAEAITREASLMDEEVTVAGNGHAVATKQLSRAEWRQIVARIFRQQLPAIEGIFRRTQLNIIGASWELLNIELGEAIQFNENDPLVVDILHQAGTRIRGIQQTTLDALQPLLADLYEEGASPDAIARQIRGLVTETYHNRARAIARTEVGMGQNQATSGRYRRAGVEHVQVLDDGFDNSHPFCRIVNGKVVTVDWAERNPLQHPNCVRAFAAVFDYNGPVFTEEVPWGS